MGLLAFGEGWHNNHHAFEFSARHGLEWWQVSGSTLYLCLVVIAWNALYPGGRMFLLLIHVPPWPFPLQLDVTWMLIRGMEILGLISNVKLPTEKQMDKLRFDTTAA